VLLAIDAGNTQTVVGLYEDDSTAAEPVHHWRVSTVPERTADEQALLIGALVEQQGKPFAEAVSGVAIASSVPAVNVAIRELADRHLGTEAVVVGPGVKSGIPILYDNPKEVGPDRIADAVAAYDLYGGPTIVVDFGTATTFEVVTAKGEYLGGAICPGVGISLDALFARAAGLRRVEISAPARVIGRSTAETLSSGATYGFASQVDGMCARVEAEVGEKCTVVATGGLAPAVVPHSTRIQHHEPWLTLHGVRLVYERNLPE
jgi:type III pantothenate kinase